MVIDTLTIFFPIAKIEKKIRDNMKQFIAIKEEKMKQKNKRIVNGGKSLATVRERERERAIL